MTEFLYKVVYVGEDEDAVASEPMCWSDVVQACDGSRA